MQVERCVLCNKLKGQEIQSYSFWCKLFTDIFRFKDMKALV